jgi:uncharacterized protein YeaO (DUF488 family)
MKKEKLKDVLWLKEIAPSSELRHWFGHRAERWAEFKQLYSAELDKAFDALAILDDKIAAGTVTLLYAARDVKNNHAIVLRDYLVARSSIKS